MALLSSSSSTPTHHLPSLSPAKSNHKPYLVSLPLTKSRNRNRITHLSVSTSDNGAGVVAATDTQDKVAETPLKEDVKATTLTKFHNPKWVNGSWDLKQFQSKDGTTDWDSLIDAEARRRKWLEANPESTNNDQPVMFDTSIIPWWAWIKRFHLPEAELLNGRAAMVGFFMAYFVDSLTGVGLVDQTNNFFCKTLLFVAVLGVLFIRKNEDLDNLNKLFQETTLYDKQWQATWQDDNNADSNKD